MQARPTAENTIRWPDLSDVPDFTELPYHHARLNLLEVESRSTHRYLRSQRDSNIIREKLDGLLPDLADFFQNSGLATAMHAIRYLDSRLSDEHRYYQDLSLDLNRLIYHAFQGLLEQEELFVLAQLFGKGSLLALHNLKLLNLEQENERARSEYRLCQEFRERYFPNHYTVFSASHSWRISSLLFYEPDYSKEELVWIDDSLYTKLIGERKQLANDLGFEHFSSLAKRRLGMLDDEPDGISLRDAVAKWLVPLACHERAVRSYDENRESTSLFPGPISTLRLEAGLKDPVRGQDIEELEQVWGRPKKQEDNINKRNPLSQAVLTLLEAVLGSETAQLVRSLQEKAYILESDPAMPISLWLPEVSLPFVAMESMQNTESFGRSIALIGYALSLLATVDDPMLMLRHPARDFQSAKGWGLLGLSLTKIETAYESKEDGVQVRNAYLIQLVNEMIFCSMAEELQNFCYSTEANEELLSEYWLRLMERWYPDLADHHEWLLAQEQSWRQMPSLVLTPYNSSAEFAARMTALRIWDLAKKDFSAGQQAYLGLISGRRSNSLEDCMGQIKWPVSNQIDAVKRLAYQLADTLEF